MKKTSINRAAWIKENPQLSICDILKEHPRLFDIPGMVSIVHRKIEQNISIQENMYGLETKPQ